MITGTRTMTSAFAVAVFVCGCCVLAESRDKVPYPVDYRNWAVAKSLVVGPQHKSFANRGGIHHYYANDKAIEGYRTGKFPDGSVIVDEGVHTKEQDGITLEAGRRSIDVMIKDSQRYNETGGWGFEHFQGDNQTDGASADVRAACFACHAKQKDRDYVFSQFRK